MKETFLIFSDNEIFRKDVNDDNIKIHQKPGFHPLFRRYIFEIKKEGGKRLSNLFLKDKISEISGIVELKEG